MKECYFPKCELGKIGPMLKFGKEINKTVLAPECILDLCI